MKDNKFKQLLSAEGVSLQKFADDAKISKRTLDPYMAGTAKWGNARLWMAIRVADELGIHPRELLEKEFIANVNDEL